MEDIDAEDSDAPDTAKSSLSGAVSVKTVLHAPDSPDSHSDYCSATSELSSTSVSASSNPSFLTVPTIRFYPVPAPAPAPAPPYVPFSVAPSPAAPPARPCLNLTTLSLTTGLTLAQLHIFTYLTQVTIHHSPTNFPNVSSIPRGPGPGRDCCGARGEPELHCAGAAPLDPL